MALKSVRDEMAFLQQMMKGIAAQFGEQCEVVLHDYSKEYSHTIVAIENGHVTGRKVGDCGTNLGLEMLRGAAPQEDEYNYLTRTKDGRILRSSSMYIRGEDGKLIGALCINWDVSACLSAFSVLEKLVHGGKTRQVNEIITNNIRDLLEALIQESIQYVGKPVSGMTKEEKTAGLKYLDGKGAFLVKHAGARVAEAYGISKNTLYNYLERYESQ